MINYMLIFVAALVFAIGATPIAKKLASRLGVMDQPSPRKIHFNRIRREPGRVERAIYLSL